MLRDIQTGVRRESMKVCVGTMHVALGKNLWDRRTRVAAVCADTCLIRGTPHGLHLSLPASPALVWAPGR